MVCGDAAQPVGMAGTAHHPGVAEPQKGWNEEMALYMDIHHHVDGLTADAVKGAHEADVATQEEFGVRYLEYWFNEGTGQVFCLVEAPNAEAAAEVHRRAHGLVADEIIEVRQGSAS
jgi:hypothetical protein